MVTVSTSTGGSATKRGYHHGDLRTAALEAARVQLGERGAEDVSLREVARAAGVSATALYRHFPDKTALLEALSDEGFGRLAAAQRAAMAAATDTKVDAFNAMGRAYVRFALGEPGLFRLMFTHTPKHDPLTIDLDHADASLSMLRQKAAELVPAEQGPAAAQRFALRAWSLVHGLALLLLDRQVEGDGAMIDAVIDIRDFMLGTGDASRS